jgi:hypothetical protein
MEKQYSQQRFKASPATRSWLVLIMAGSRIDTIPFRSPGQKRSRISFVQSRFNLYQTSPGCGIVVKTLVLRGVAV